MGQPNSNAELHIQLHLVEEILAVLKLSSMIVPSTLSTKLISSVIDLLVLNLCSNPMNYDLSFFSAIIHYFFSYFEKEMEKDIASIFIQSMLASPFFISCETSSMTRYIVPGELQFKVCFV